MAAKVTAAQVVGKAAAGHDQIEAQGHHRYHCVVHPEKSHHRNIG